MPRIRVTGVIGLLGFLLNKPRQTVGTLITLITLITGLLSMMMLMYMHMYICTTGGQIGPSVTVLSHTLKLLLTREKNQKFKTKNENQHDSGDHSLNELLGEFEQDDWKVYLIILTTLLTVVTLVTLDIYVYMVCGVGA